MNTLCQQNRRNRKYSLFSRHFSLFSSQNEWITHFATVLCNHGNITFSQIANKKKMIRWEKENETFSGNVNENGITITVDVDQWRVLFVPRVAFVPLDKFIYDAFI